MTRGLLDAELGGAGATGAERGAAEVEHGERHAQPFAQLAENVFLGHEHVLERQPRRRGAAHAALGHPLFHDLEAGHLGRDQKRGDLGFLAAGHRRARHDGQPGAMPPLVIQRFWPLSR